MFGSYNSRSHRSSYITVYWCGSDGFIRPFEIMYLNHLPGKINYFIIHFLYVNDVDMNISLLVMNGFFEDQITSAINLENMKRWVGGKKGEWVPFSGAQIWQALIFISHIEVLYIYNFIFSLCFLYSGTAKGLLETCKAKGYSTPDNLKTIQRIVDSAVVPSDVGKLLGIIDNLSFDSFTTDKF